jgi:hypothetical protein
MFSTSRLLARFLGTDTLADMAERVAGRSRLAAWQRVMHRLPTLGPTEARGYVRARAAVVIREETDRLIEQEGIKVARQRTEIETAALDMLIRMITSQLSHRQYQTGPRRAA